MSASTNWLNDFAERHNAVSLHDICLPASSVKNHTELRMHLEAGVRIFDLRELDLKALGTIKCFLQTSTDIIFVVLNKIEPDDSSLPIVSEQTLRMPLRSLLHTTHRVLQLPAEIWLQEPRPAKRTTKNESECFRLLMQALSHNKLQSRTSLYGMSWRIPYSRWTTNKKAKTRNLNRRFLEFAMKNKESLSQCMNVIFFDDIIDTGIIELFDMMNRASFHKTYAHVSK